MEPINSDLTHEQQRIVRVLNEASRETDPLQLDIIIGLVLRFADDLASDADFNRAAFMDACGVEEG
jgi:hypothetical protein